MRPPRRGARVGAGPTGLSGIRGRKPGRKLAEANLRFPGLVNVPPHLELDSSKTTAKVIGRCKREWVAMEVNELLVVEYCSRKVWTLPSRYPLQQPYPSPQHGQREETRGRVGYCLYARSVRPCTAGKPARTRSSLSLGAFTSSLPCPAEPIPGT